MAVDLDERAGQGPDAVGQIGGDIADEQRPDGGVQWRTHKKPHESHTDDDPRKGEGQEGEGLQNAGGMGANFDDYVRRIGIIYSSLCFSSFFLFLVYTILLIFLIRLDRVHRHDQNKK